MNARRWWELGAGAALALSLGVCLTGYGYWTLRHHALEQGIIAALDANDGATVRSLFRQGFLLHPRDGVRRTPLIWASVFGDDTLAREALRRGDDVNAKAQDAMTALMWAASGGHVTLVRMLLAAGAAVNARDAQGRTALSWAADGLRSPDPVRKRAVIQVIRRAGGAR